MNPKERMQKKLRIEAIVGQKANRLLKDLGFATFGAFEIAVREKFAPKNKDDKPATGSKTAKVASRSISFSHGVGKYAREKNVDPNAVKKFVLDQIEGDIGDRKVEKTDVDAYLEP